MTEHEAETTFAPVPFDPGLPPAEKKRRPPPRPKPRRARKTPSRSKADMCLLSIARLEDVWKAGGVPKTAIVVDVWQANERFAFGLAGYEDTHPDSNRVIMELVKIKNGGYIRQPRESHYALTLAGHEVVAKMLPGAA